MARGGSSRRGQAKYNPPRQERDYDLSIPSLPMLQSPDIILTVFTHKSLQSPGPSANFDANQGLAALGESVLDTVVTKILFSRRPMLSGDQIVESRKRVLSDSNFLKWVKLYKLKNRLRCTPDVLHTPEEARTLFCAYVGGIIAESISHLELVQSWMDALIRDERLTDNPFRPAPPPSATTPPTHKKVKSEELSPVPLFFGRQPLPPEGGSGQREERPPTRQRPPHRAMPSTPNLLSSLRPDAPFLPLFNELATKRGAHVEYPSTSSGPLHAPIWTVQCVVNGIVKGTGEGHNKSMAKEMAAREAYIALGWA
ncbi:hypothetical protein AX16_009881 [Volvariella volvacea WC 439]|nr:hypothetical protein AX16_009881 [Volvariella volvacea WC 439]